MSKANEHKPGYKHTPLGWIPEAWSVLKLNEILKEARLGGNYENAEANNGIPVIKMGNIGRGKINLDTVQSLPEDCEYNEEDVLKKGDLLFNTRNTLDLVGKVSIWNNELPFAIYNSNLLRLKFKEEFVGNNIYMNCVFNSYYGLKQLRAFATGTTSVAAIYGRDLEHFKCLVPNKSEQIKIAAILSTWDKAISKTQQLIAQLQQSNKGLMQQLLTAKHDWKEYRIGDLLKEVKRPVAWNDEELYHLISVRRRSGGAFFRESLYGKQILTKQLFTAEAGDFLISKMQIVHGASAVVPPEFTGMKISGSYISLHAKDDVVMDINFFNWLSKTRWFYRLTYVSSYGVHIEKMTFDFDDFKRRKIMLPPSVEEQKRIVKILQTANDEVRLYEQRLVLLQQQKKGLMQKLLTGEVRVKIDNTQN